MSVERAIERPGLLRAPFPWFGGKSRAAHLVWERFGDVPNYVEPFFGSGAVLLGRPHAPGVETINDLNGWVTNFWRALQQDPEGLAAWADYPVSELDLHARGDWLFYGEAAAVFCEKMRSAPDYYCIKRAGWWVWGQCAWIGSGWGPRQLPHLGDAGRGINRQRPHLGDAGRGINRQLPHLGNAGMGINRKRPHLGNAGMGGSLGAYLAQLSERLRRVRICCGDWTRVLGPSPTTRLGVTGVFLDPPYSFEERTGDLYTGHDAENVAPAVRAWAIEHGPDPLFRIALCGYEGEHEMPPEWETVSWKAHGGYGSQGDGAGRENAHRERIWFSPHCLAVESQARPLGLFEAGV